MGARGNSGVILCQILRGLVSTLRGRVRGIGGDQVAEALAAASDAAYQAVLKPIEGTILTVVRESADGGRARRRRWRFACRTCCAPPATPGERPSTNTPELLPVLKDAGVVDAGGAGFLLLLDSALHVVDGEPLPEPLEATGVVGPAALRRGGTARVQR